MQLSAITSHSFNPKLFQAARTVEAQIAASTLLAYAAAFCMPCGPALSLGFGATAIIVALDERMHPKVQPMPTGKFNKYDLEPFVLEEPWLKTLTYVALALNICGAVFIMPFSFGANLAFSAGAMLIFNRCIK